MAATAVPEEYQIYQQKTCGHSLGEMAGTMVESKGLGTNEVQWLGYEHYHTLDWESGEPKESVPSEDARYIKVVNKAKPGHWQVYEVIDPAAVAALPSGTETSPSEGVGTEEEPEPEPEKPEPTFELPSEVPIQPPSRDAKNDNDLHFLSLLTDPVPEVFADEVIHTGKDESSGQFDFGNQAGVTVSPIVAVATPSAKTVLFTLVNEGTAEATYRVQSASPQEVAIAGSVRVLAGSRQTLQAEVRGDFSKGKRIEVALTNDATEATFQRWVVVQPTGKSVPLFGDGSSWRVDGESVSMQGGPGGRGGVDGGVGSKHRVDGVVS